jgi:hypothetical protein
MSEQWATRQRNTNRLVRKLAESILKARATKSDQLFGLCKLTWITSSFDGENATYVKSTKIPALGFALQRDYEQWSIEEVAADVVELLGDESVRELVVNPTGFTNFYKAYRNSAREWVHAHRAKLLPMFRSAYGLGDDDEGLALTRLVEKLPRIPKARHSDQGMRPEYLLTPIFFSLDGRLRYPIINGAKDVSAVLAKLGIRDASLATKYLRMIELQGKGGISDAADLDQIGKQDLPDFLDGDTHGPKKQVLAEQPTEDEELPLKDEADIRALQAAGTRTQKRLHNQLTNRLKRCLGAYTLLEGRSQACRFDVLVKNYNRKKADLLIEVKSADDMAQIRMAVGQLFSYWLNLKGDTDHHMALLLPTAPSSPTRRLLEWLGIGVLWFDGESLETCNLSLRTIARMNA